MANSDDDSRGKRGSAASAPSSGSQLKKTLLGLGPIKRVPAPSSLRRTREDFEAEATEIAPKLVDLVLEDIDVDIDMAFGVSSEPGVPAPPDADRTPSDEGASPMEDGQVAAAEFPDGGATMISAPAVEALAEDAAREARAYPIVEDPLPEPIYDHAPSPDEEPELAAEAQPPPTRVDIVKRPFTADEGDLPLPIHDERSPATDHDWDETPSFDDERTALLDSPFEEEPAVARLIALDGPSAGQEYFATSLRNTVGRGLNNTIVVADLAMSRQHFEIVKNPDESYSLYDLQSVNGTTLNGTKVREGDLYHGDRIDAGKSTFQFVVSGNAPAASRQRRMVPSTASTLTAAMPAVTAPPPAAAATPVNRVFLWGGIAAMGLALLIMSVVAILAFDEDMDTGASSSPVEASEVYLDGVTAVKERDWDRAQVRFESARALDPTLPGVDEQLQRIEREREAAGVLEEAKELVEAGELETALLRIDTIPSSSVYFSEANDLRRSARAAEAERLYTAAQEAFDADDVAGARAHASELLRIIPTHEGAQRLLGRISALDVPAQAEEAESRGEAAERRSRDDRSRSARDGVLTFDFVEAGSKKPRKPRAPDASARAPDFLRGFMLYRTRRFDEAERFFQEAAEGDSAAASLARDLAGHVQAFRANYDAGDAAMRASDWAEADARYAAARRADSKIASGRGHFDGELRKKIATVKAKRGLAALADGELAVARNLADEARANDATSAATRELQQALSDAAGDRYVQAVNLRKSDPNGAAKLCREIQALVPSSHEAHRKAAQLLQSL